MPQRLLDQLETPALMPDEDGMHRNIERMRSQSHCLGASFTPCIQTRKCIDVRRRLRETPQGPITVFSLQEARYFAARGVESILDDVWIVPNKLDRRPAGTLQASELLTATPAACACWSAW